MKKKFLLLLFLSGFISYNSFSQLTNASSCPDATIYDATNDIGCSSDTIQLTCDMPSITLSPKVFAPGASSGYIVESIPYTPPCPYTISPTAIDYYIPDDDVWGQLMDINFGQSSEDPEFVFSFYGQDNLKYCVIGSNGLLSWDQSLAGTYCAWSFSSVQPIPTTTTYTNTIFGPFHDTDFNAVGGIGKMYFEILGEYPCRMIVLSFDNVPMFSCNSMRAYNMIVLYETTNTIEFYMQNKPLCSSWNSGKAILGIQNATGTEATVVSNYNLPEQWSATNEAWRIRPEGNLNSWTQWYRRPASGGAKVAVESNDDYETIASPDSDDGPQWYIMETTIQRLDAIELEYADSCLIIPIDLPAFVINHNGNTGLYDTICLGSSMNISLEGGDNYRMIAPTIQEIQDPNSITVTPTQNTTYIFEVDNYENGQRICTRQDSVMIHPRSFEVAIIENMTICKNDTIRLWNIHEEKVEGASYWYYNINDPISTSDTLVYAPQNTGIINYKLIDNYTCEATASINVTVNDSPIVSISGNDRICLGDPTTLTANSSLTNCVYEWSTGQTTSSITVIPTANETEYEVSVKYGPSECETIESITVYALDKPIVNTNPDISICYSDSAQIYVTGNADNYIWRSFPVDQRAEGSTELSLTVSPEVTTMYIAKGFNGIGCENADTVYVRVNPLPIAQMSFNPAVIDDLDPTVIFTDRTSGSVARTWQISDGGTSTESIFVHLFELNDTNQSYTIRLYVENDAGCEDSTTSIIRISKTHYLWAPNTVYVYDPDPRISQFRVYVDNTSEFELQIFNRWGERLFSTTNPEFAWDCKYNGDLVPQGTYVWVARYRYPGKRNETVTEKGSFTIYK